MSTRKEATNLAHNLRSLLIIGSLGCIYECLAAQWPDTESQGPPVAGGFPGSRLSCLASSTGASARASLFCSCSLCLLVFGGAVQSRGSGLREGGRNGDASAFTNTCQL